MKLAADILLCAAVASAWFGVFAFVRLSTPLERIHALTFTNIMTIGTLVLAAFLSQGPTAQTFKCLFIWLAAVVIGGLLSHATGRAIHLRSGERR